MYLLHLFVLLFVSASALQDFKEVCKDFLSISDTRVGPNYPREENCIRKADKGKKGICCVTGFRKTHKVVFRAHSLREKICIILKCEYENEKWHWERCKCEAGSAKFPKVTTKAPEPPIEADKPTPKKPATTPKPESAKRPASTKAPAKPKTTPIRKSARRKTTPAPKIPEKVREMQIKAILHKSGIPIKRIPSPLSDRKVIYHHIGCEYEGKFYSIGDEIPVPCYTPGKICNGAYCSNDGEIKRWECNFCDITTEVVLPPTSAPMRLTTYKGNSFAESQRDGIDGE